MSFWRSWKYLLLCVHTERDKTFCVYFYDHGARWLLNVFTYECQTFECLDLWMTSWPMNAKTFRSLVFFLTNECQNFSFLCKLMTDNIFLVLLNLHESTFKFIEVAIPFQFQSLKSRDNVSVYNLITKLFLKQLFKK